MSLRLAILTALSERESTGAELTRRFDRSFGYFWAATHQQIYRELARLHDDGLIVETPSEDAGGRGAPRTFAATTAGREALTEWVGAQEDPAPLRDAIMVKVRAAAVTGQTERLAGALRHQLAVHEANLQTYQEIERRDFADASAPEDRLRHLVLQGGLSAEAARVQWCRDALALVDSLR